MENTKVLRALVAIVAIAFLAPRAWAAPMAVTELAPGVYVHQGRHEVQSADNRGDISNASFVVGSEAVAISSESRY
jgi:hypothetical protein